MVLISAQTMQTNKSWLEQPMKGRNRAGNDLPTLPRPSAMSNDAEIFKRCFEQIRQISNTAEEAIAKMGWKLYGAMKHFKKMQF